MRLYIKGLLIGVGIGLLVTLITLMSSENLRNLLRERYVKLRNSLPDNEQLKQAGQQFAAGVTQTASTVKDYTQQAASKVKDTGSSLGDLAQQAKQQTIQQVKQTGQETVQTLR